MKRVKSILMLSIPYVVTVFLPMISTFWLSSMLSSGYYKRIMEDKEISIKSACERFYQRMDNVKELSYLIAENDAVNRYVYRGLSVAGNSVIDNIEMCELLTNFMTNGDVETIFIYDANGNKIITPTSAYSDAVNYFKFVYGMKEDAASKCVERLKAVMEGNKFSTYIKEEVGQETTEWMEFSLLLPLGRIAPNRFQLVVVMKKEHVLSDLHDVLEEGDEIYLYDSKDELIYSNGGRYEQLLESETDSELQLCEGENGEIYGLVCYANDRSLKLKIYISDIIHQGDIQTTYAWILMGASLLASIVFCTFFTFRNHREIQAILGEIKGQKKSPEKERRYLDVHGYRQIREYTDRIIAENNEIKESIPKFRDSRKYEMLDKLIRNTSQSTETIDSFSGKCVVFCIRYKGSSYRAFLNENVTIKDCIKDLLSEIVERKFEIFDTSSRETIFVLSMQDEVLRDVAENIISRLNVDVVYYYNVEVEVGVGKIVDSIYQISESYQQAKAVLRYRESSGQNIYLFDDLVQLEDVYYYPKDYDEKIYNYVVACKNLEAKEIIQKIYMENFEESDRILTGNAIESIKRRLRDTLMLLVGKYDFADNLSMKDKLVGLNNEQSVISFFGLVREMIDMICDNAMDKKKDVQQHTSLKIMQYINDNYCDNMLSLKKISHELGLHESYISNVFRTEYGEPVSVVIERRRIEKACKLIKNTDGKISDIAQAVGYSSDVSFRRAFKKIVGVSPGEYRGKAEAEV